MIEYFFPYELFFKWLSYPGDHSQQIKDNMQIPETISYIERREFSFENNNQNITFYQRYQSFSNPKDLEQVLVGKNNCATIQKIDIGAVFKIRPLKTGNNIAVEKEFFIDIDMTDYDNVRTCCQNAEICDKCWKFMRVAGEILYEALTQDFGFEDILWVFSGRRGMHLWICDQSARMMQNQVRKAIVKYLSIVKVKKEFESNPLGVILRVGQQNHPAVQRALKHIRKNFIEIICKDQDLLQLEEPRQQIIQLIKHIKDDFSQQLDKEWQKAIKLFKQEDQSENLSEVLWKKFLVLKDQYVEDNKNKKKFVLHNYNNDRTLECMDDEIMLIFLYPRLDEKVSETINHLLKAPFCIHPKTRKVCVPLNYEDLGSFNPNQVPKLEELITQEKIDLLKANLKQNPISQSDRGLDDKELNTFILSILNQGNDKDYHFLGLTEDSPVSKYMKTFCRFLIKYQKHQQLRNAELNNLAQKNSDKKQNNHGF